MRLPKLARSTKGKSQPKHFKVSRVEKAFKFSLEKFIKIKLPPRPKLEFIKDPNVYRRRSKILNHFRDKQVYRFITRMPNCLCAIYGIQTVEVLDLIIYYVNRFEVLVAEHGEVYAIGLLKSYHGIALRYAANSKFEPLPYQDMDEKKLPIWLTPFRPLLEGDINRRRAALCILSLYKTAPLCGDSPSLESITKRFEYPIKIRGTHRGEFLEQVNDHLFRSGSVARTKDAYMVVPYFKQVLEEMFPRTDCKRRLKQISSLNELHVTPRKGPNGSAIGTALADLLALYHSPHLLDSIRSLARLINHYDLLDLLDTDPTTSELLENREGKDALHSRLAIKLEPGAKTRFFAICDYFTQSVLKGFHKWIFRYLSGLREDGTKSQDSVCKIVKQWTIDRKSVV